MRPIPFESQMKSNGLHLAAIAAMTVALAGCFNDRAPHQALALPPDLTRTVPGMIFPLVPGAEWIYEGKIRWSEGKNTYSKNVVWTMKAVELCERDGYSIYVIRGFPSDIAWNTALEIKDSVIVRAGDRYYKTGPAAYLHLRGGRDLGALLRNEETILDFPLEIGKAYGAADAADLEAQRGCWVVKDILPLDLSSIRGAADKLGQCYRLLFSSPSDRLRLDFVPYLGFTAVSYLNYRHPFEAELRLVEFKKPAAMR